MSEDLIKNYTITKKTPECHPGSTSFNLFINIDDDITEVLPYLNSELEGDLDYRHKDAILLWAGSEKRHTFRAHEIAVSSFQEGDDGEAYAKKTADMINDVWARRADIVPKTEGLPPIPKALDIYKILPRTNCKKCGFPTCMAYAVELQTNPEKLSDCEHISEEDFRKTIPDQDD